jgi:hypothetical protein
LILEEPRKKSVKDLTGQIRTEVLSASGAGVVGVED